MIEVPNLQGDKAEDFFFFFAFFFLFCNGGVYIAAADIWKFQQILYQFGLN